MNNVPSASVDKKSPSVLQPIIQFCEDQYLLLCARFSSDASIKAAYRKFCDQRSELNLHTPHLSNRRNGGKNQQYVSEGSVEKRWELEDLVQQALNELRLLQNGDR